MPARPRPLTPAEAAAAGHPERGANAADPALRAIRAGLSARAPRPVTLAAQEPPSAAPAPTEPARLWTAERDEALRRMWFDEELPQSAIAAALSEQAGRTVSRGTVAQRISQMRWTGRRKNQGCRRVVVTMGGRADAPEGRLAEGLPSRRTRKDPAPKSTIAQFPESRPSHPPSGWPIADLRAGQCRFACTDDRAPPEAHRFCGAPTEIGRGNPHGSWCPEHLAVVWGRGRAGARRCLDEARVTRR